MSSIDTGVDVLAHQGEKSREGSVAAAPRWLFRLLMLADTSSPGWLVMMMMWMMMAVMNPRSVSVRTCEERRGLHGAGPATLGRGRP